ncbi:hypothetical protein [Azohydromonas lata]|uniref:hypothetical protein n=1 Tax=Azohydromonas lata TaxID=45677 RepID=UPI0012F5236A|nr:hypothetical protein [Azohydromonas lata]
MLNEESFRSFVKAAQALEVDQAIGCENITERVDFSNDNRRLPTQQKIIDYCETQIKEALRCDGFDATRLLRLKKQFTILSFIAADKDTEYCQRILQVICRCTKDFSSLPLAKEPWVNAISFSIACIRAGAHTLGITKDYYAQEHSIAQAYKRMAKRGYKIEIVDGYTNISTETQNKIAAAIDTRIKQFGQGAAFQIYESIAKNFNSAYKRYSFKRISREPLIPWGYIHNLSIKNLRYSAPKKIGLKKAWSEALSLATDYCTLLDVQEYSNMEIIFPPKNMDILSHLKRMVLIDQIYQIKQYNEDDILDLVQGVYGAVNTEKYSLPWSTEDYLVVARCIIDLSRKSGLQTISKDHIFAGIGHALPKEKTLEILSCLHHEPEQVNSGYLYPVDAEKENYHYKPLVKLNENTFYVGNLSFSCFGFLEVIASKYRHLGVTESTVGDLLEDYVGQKLAATGAKYMANEKYKINAQQREELDLKSLEGECDFIIETDDNIIFIELKKKILGRKAQGGDVLRLAFDLSQSFLLSQVQANWHEIILKRYKRIYFNSGKILELNGKTIEKLSLSMLDFFSLHDRLVAQKLLEEFSRRRLHVESNKKSITTDVSKVNKLLDELNKQIKMPELSHHRNGIFKFATCQFLNLSQFTSMLRNCNSPEDIHRHLTSHKHITTGEKDRHSENIYFNHNLKRPDIYDDR